MRRSRSVDPDAARRLARQSLTRLARLRDATGHDIHETAQQAYELGLTYAEIGEALGIPPGTAWDVAHHDGTVSPRICVPRHGSHAAPVSHTGDRITRLGYIDGTGQAITDRPPGVADTTRPGA